MGGDVISQVTVSDIEEEEKGGEKKRSVAVAFCVCSEDASVCLVTREQSPALCKGRKEECRWQRRS